MSSVSEIFDRSQIQKSEYAVYAGFDESLIKSGVGYLEQIHVFVSAEVDANSPLLVELGRIFSPFSSILLTGSSWYRMPVFKAGVDVDGDVWDFDELTYFTASKFADGGSSAKTPLTVISLAQTPRLADSLTGFSGGSSSSGGGEKNEKRRQKKGKERDRGDKDESDKGDNDKGPGIDPREPFGGTIAEPAQIFFDIVSKIYPVRDNQNAFQTLTIEGSLTIKVVLHSYMNDYSLIKSCRRHNQFLRAQTHFRHVIFDSWGLHLALSGPWRWHTSNFMSGLLSIPNIKMPALSGKSPREPQSPRRRKRRRHQQKRV